MRYWYRPFEQAPIWGISLSSNHQLDITSLSGPWHTPQPQVQYTSTCPINFNNLSETSERQPLTTLLQQAVKAQPFRKKPKAVVAVPSAQVIGQLHHLEHSSLCLETPEAHEAQAAYAHQQALQHWPSDAADMALDYRCEQTEAPHTTTLEWVACHRKWIQEWDHILREAGLSPYRIEPEHQAWWRALHIGEQISLKTDPIGPPSTMTDTSNVIALLSHVQAQLTLTLWVGPHCLYRHHNTLTAGAEITEQIETLSQHLQRARVTTGVRHWSQCYLCSDLTLEYADKRQLEQRSELTFKPLPFGLKTLNQLTSWGLALQGRPTHA